MNPKRFLIVSVTFLSGLYFFIEFLLPEELGGYKFGKYHEQIILGVRIVGSMAFGLGILNIAQVHGGRILRGQSGWENSVALILGFVIMLLVDGSQFYYSVKRSRHVEELDHLNDFIQVVEEERISGRMALLSEPSTPPGPRIKTITPVLEKHEARWQAALAKRADKLDAQQKEKGAKLLQSIEAAKAGVGKLAAAYDDITHEKFGDGPLSPTDLPDNVIKPLVAEIKGIATLERDLGRAISDGDVTSKMSHLLYDGFFTTLASAMFSLLAFYIAGAAYRAFRVRSMEASMLMLTAILVILGQIPQGRAISEHLPAIRKWLLEYVNTPGNRAIYFGSAIAGLAMAVRMWLSLEQSPLDSTSKERGDA